MCEYTKGRGARVATLVLHDDGEREYGYVPRRGLPDTDVGRFTQELYDEAVKGGWIVVSMKKDWKRIVAFEGCSRRPALSVMQMHASSIHDQLMH